jgi:hypothetical protein
VGTGVGVGTVVSVTVPVGAGDGTAVATDEVAVDGLVGDRDGRGLGWCVIAATRRRQCSDGERPVTATVTRIAAARWFRMTRTYPIHLCGKQSVDVGSI